MVKASGYLLTLLLCISLFIPQKALSAAPKLDVQARSTQKINALVFSDEPNPLLQQVLNGIQEHFKHDSNYKFREQFLFWKRQQNWQEELQHSDSNVIVVVGEQSYRKVQSLPVDIPTVYLWIDEQQLTELKQEKIPGTFGISHKQPLVRYFALIKALNIYQSHTGILLDKDEPSRKEQQKELANFYDLPLTTLYTNKHHRGKDAAEQLSKCCNIYLIPEASTNADATIQRSIIINSARNRLLSIAYSPALLQDGAMIALYSSPYEVGLQSGSLIQTAVSNPTTNNYQQPFDFSLKINRNVATILGYSGISLGDLMTKVNTLEFLFIQIGRMK